MSPVGLGAMIASSCDTKVRKQQFLDPIHSR
jgi:hypothetical protein